MVSIKKLAIRGTAWILFGYGASQFLRLVGNIILTRLLFPELFGLMSLVQTFIMGLQLFSDVGINPSIIRHPNGDKSDFLNTGWTIQIIRGFCLWFCACAIAWPISQIYEEPRLLWLIPIVALSSIVAGFNSTSIASLSRHMELGKLTLFELGIQLISLPTLILFAYLYQSIWALVIGRLIASIIKMVGSHLLFGRLNPNRFAWDKEAVHEFLTYGRWIFISTAMTFLATQADRLILGKLMPIEVLGIYTVALTFSDIQRKIAQRINKKILLPAISKRQDLPRKILKNKILPKRWLTLILIMAIINVLWNFGDVLISVLYDIRYKDAGWMLPILSLGLWPMMLNTTVDSALYAIGKPLYNAIGNALKAIYMFILVPIAFNLMGIPGVIIAIAFNDLPSYIVVSFGLYREKLNFLAQDLSSTIILLLSLITIGMIRYFSGFGWSLSGIQF